MATLFKKLVTTILISSFLAGVFTLPVSAVTQSLSPAGKVSFTFDDGYASAFNKAAPILAKYGIKGTEYAITGCVGMTKTPNTCAAAKNVSYMSWAQLIQLQNSYGWEIGSHTVTHPRLSRVNATRLNTELSKSRSDLAAHGINATDFATPYGDYNNNVLAAIAKYYSTQRGYADLGYNGWPYSDYYLKVERVTANVPVATVENYINTSMANHTWLILVFHDIRDRVGTNPSQDAYSLAGLDQIAAYVHAQGAPTITVNMGPVHSDTNLMPNPSFNMGLAGGWTTNSPSTITADNLTNGSYPDPTYSIKMTSAATTRHLFSPPIAVSSSSRYLVKNYLSVTKNSGGEVGFYIDEYNAAGNWISGQYKATEASAFTEELNIPYTPSSASVAKASLQVIVSSTGAINAYLDNVEWIPL